MHASIQGALAQINVSWKAFQHRDQKMTKKEVKAVLEYADKKGYKSTSELSKDEVDLVLQQLKK